MHRFDPTSLREYDIRGIVGETLGPKDAHAIGRGFAKLLRDAADDGEPSLLNPACAVGRDGRESSPELEDALVEGLTQGVVDVVRVGLGPTPMLYYAAATHKVIVVAGGNPYVIRQFPRVGSYLVTYGRGDALERASARAVLGLAPITGRAPVSLPGYFARGDGLTRDATTATAAAPGTRE